jgi:uncharacterized protein (TIGR03790 family)
MTNRLRANRIVIASLALAVLLLMRSSAAAGGGPENVLVVVNENSESSLSIANHYIALRRIPATNVVYLPWKGDLEKTDVATFRSQILEPVLAAIRRRNLAPQIDYVIYSSDFPWSIDLSGDFKDGAKLPPQLKPTASLNGATYLHQFVAAKSRAILSMSSNQYVQRPSPTTHATRSIAFLSSDRWAFGGKKSETGASYMLSTMLGVTSGRGNTVKEVISYLDDSAAADGSRPSGTIYYMKNNNVRSTTREWAFAGAVAELKELGVAARVVDGQTPQRKIDVAGAMIGTSDFNWAKSNSRILPGAICEHLTSFGGVLKKGAGQTPLTEFLRYGAAGSCGTVVEPYAIQAKFPLATMQVHYARGCSLAESFYQSVAAPYQLLIVGDPLCRPWAKIPKTSVEGIRPGEEVQGARELKPRAQLTDGGRVRIFEMFIDGERSAGIQPGGSIELDTTMLDDGYHELRVVAIQEGPIATQGTAIVPLVVNNHDRAVELRGPASVGLGEKFRVTFQAEAAESVEITLNGRKLAETKETQGSLEIDATQLGRGPVRLQAIARGEHQARSAPLAIDVQ